MTIAMEDYFGGVIVFIPETRAVGFKKSLSTADWMWLVYLVLQIFTRPGDLKWQARSIGIYLLPREIHSCHCVPGHFLY